MMGTKRYPSRYDCYAAAEFEEPLFVLLARDKDAPYLVREWARGRELKIRGGTKPLSDLGKVREAEECAAAMAAWYAANKGGR